MESNDKQLLNYSNIALVSHSENDFIIEFGVIVPFADDWNSAKIKSEAKTIIKIAQSPKHFKRLLNILQGELEIYEKENGVISLGK